MRNCIVFVVCLLTALTCKSQSKTVVIYADPSQNINNYSLSNKLYDVAQETESKVLIYISNGTTPIVATSIYDMQDVVAKLSRIKSTEIDYKFDLDSINRLFTNENILSSIAFRENNSLNDEVYFFFFFDIKKCREKEQVEKFVEMLLLSNRLLQKQGLITNCKVKIYLSGIQSTEDAEYLSYLKQTNAYTFIEY